MTIGSGGSPGVCTFDFGFKISDRFFTASPVGKIPHGVNCDFAFHDPNLGCRVRNLAGAGVDGRIMVVIY